MRREIPPPPAAFRQAVDQLPGLQEAGAQSDLQDVQSACNQGASNATNVAAAPDNPLAARPVPDTHVIARLRYSVLAAPDTPPAGG